MPGEITALCLLAIIAAGTLLANRLVTPYPVILTAIGLALAFIPGFPSIELQPDLVLRGILPPLVYCSAVVLPWDEFRDNLRPISLMAVGLVAATIAAIAAVAHALVPNLSWAQAVALGAIVSPTDPVASTAVASRLGVPRRLITIIEGEGLVNDAVSLTILKLALAVILTGAFSLPAGVLRFLSIVIGEIAFGALVGWIISKVRTRIEDPSVDITVSLLTPYLAYLPPEMLGGSGILATVAAGMYVGVQTPAIAPSGTRLHLTSVWDIVVYLLNGILFLLTGLQFRSTYSSLGGLPAHHLVLDGAIIAAVAVVVRIAWVWPSLRLPRLLTEHMPHRQMTFLAWCGMRGGISLAAALSIPHRVPARGLLIFWTACTIAGTLLVQGITLPFLIRLLRLDRDAREETSQEYQHEAAARLEMIRAAAASLDGEQGEDVDLLRKFYEHRQHQWGQLHDRPAEGARMVNHELDWRRRALAAERQCLLRMYDAGKVSEEMRNRIQRDLDLEEVRISRGISVE